uniref:MSP domain-containing protein n=1 Tax=Mimiviridae sp. ChoanoV1 TaxID=2596887 RepID=A0A5B8HUT1_9VIRU|nr:hypothetical protein 1_44 [Mimiviridae sp. ChoanoV1]
MDNNTFFNSKNKDLLYNICRDEIVRETNYNIDDNRKYYRTFGEIMKIVYKHADNKNDLTTLNKLALGKTIPYLKTEIEKKKVNSGPLLPPNNLVNKNTGKKYEDLRRDNPPMNSVPTSLKSQGTNLQYENRNVDQNYEELMKERNNFYSQQNNTKQNNTKQNNIIQNNTKQNNTEQDNINSIQDYDLDNNSLGNIQNALNNDVGYSIDNMNTYDSSNDKVDPMKLVEQYNSQREAQDNEYLKIQNEKDNFEKSNSGNNQFINNMLEERNATEKIKEQEFQESLNMKITREMNSANIDDIKGQLDDISDFVEKNKEAIKLPTANDLSVVQNNNIYQNNSLFEAYKKNVLEKRNYINREHFVTINSGDRDWFNNQNENRFAFHIQFGKEGDSIERVNTGTLENPVYENRTFKGNKSAGVQDKFKNIVSFEMVRVLLPIENIIIPFDNRIFIDFKSLPYVILKIDEIDGLYSGTNDKIDKAFAHLIWDKDNTSEVIASSEFTADLSEFSRKVKRGYCLMAPLGLEKKTYYPSPLAGLNRITLNLTTPSGKEINNHPDVLDIEEISIKNFADDGTLYIKDTHSFPNDNKVYYLEITTKTFFSNKMFKIGDNIIISNFITNDSSKLTNEFINREEGHYIINLELEVTARNSPGNEGYIQKICIAPPGDLDFKATDTSTLVKNKIGTITDTDLLATNTTCKLINQSLQSNYVFKIVTREDDITNVIPNTNI